MQPVQIAGVFTHNWESKSEKGVGRISLDQLEVDTDISDVDEALPGILKSWKPAPLGAVPAQAMPPKAPVTPLLIGDAGGRATAQRLFRHKAACSC